MAVAGRCHHRLRDHHHPRNASFRDGETGRAQFLVLPRPTRRGPRVLRPHPDRMPIPGCGGRREEAPRGRRHTRGRRRARPPRPRPARTTPSRATPARLPARLPVFRPCRCGAGQRSTARADTRRPRPSPPAWRGVRHPHHGVPGLPQPPSGRPDRTPPVGPLWVDDPQPHELGQDSRVAFLAEPAPRPRARPRADVGRPQTRPPQDRADSTREERELERLHAARDPTAATPGCRV